MLFLVGSRTTQDGGLTDR